MAIRYMGTKRVLAPLVRQAILDLQPQERVADLFSGMGSVASSLAPDLPILANDALSFTAAFARARFMESRRSSADSIIRRLIPYYSEHYRGLLTHFRGRIEAEEDALVAGQQSLWDFMNTAPHVGNSPWYKDHADYARQLRGEADLAYCLASLYFSSGYFGTRQAMELDALRYAIDRVTSDGYGGDRDWLLSSWISAAAVVINAPGHTAQYLKPTNENAYRRIRRQWARGVWSTFLDQLGRIQLCGDRNWRLQNRITSMDALEFVEDQWLVDKVGLVYADPPYTVDQYSRYYHVYETLYLYDFPDSVGIGRYRADRFRTTFSLASSVLSAFERLLSGISRARVPLVLSYPSTGLLIKKGTQLDELLTSYFTIHQIIEVELEHSTMGASKGASKKTALERIYVCSP